MRIETFYKVILGIIVIVVIGQIKDNVVSKNEKAIVVNEKEVRNE